MKKHRIKVVYLSTYSAEFNPIENCWSKIKEYLRGVATRIRDDLEIALMEAIEQVTLTHIINWFTDCCYCTSSSSKVL
ncbi:MAG: transposase [Microcoleaceae cyanobacterium]